jgi:hypothetical protein
MLVLEAILDRAEKLDLPMAKNMFIKTNKKPLPEPPYLIYLVEETQRGSDQHNLLREIDASIELYTDRTPDEGLEARIENEVLFDVSFRKYQASITNENMVQTAYEFAITQKKEGKIKKWTKELF